MNRKAIIIGSGFGGLSAAIRLQALGFETHIYEKNSQIGGQSSQLKHKGYTFDMGPSLITVPFIIQELFDLNNEKMDTYLKLTKLDPYYRIYFHDKTFIDYNGNPEQMKTQLTKFNNDDAKNYDKFLKYSSNIYKAVILEGLGGQPFLTWGDFLKFAPKALKLSAVYPGYSVVSRYFKDYRSRFIFSFHPLFLGGNPFTSPSIFLMLPALEKEGGVWYCQGGMYSVITELAALLKRMGGKVHTNSEILKLNVKGNKISSAIVNNNEVNADIFVSNAHFANTYMDLIDQKNRKIWTNSKIKSKSYGMSCFLMYLGVKKKFPQLKHHTLILSQRYKGLVDDIFKNKTLAEDFSMYLHVPSKTDPSMAPEGSESIYFLAPTPNLTAKIDWDKTKEAYGKKILDFLEYEFGMTGLQENLEVKEYFTPKDFELTRNNYLGAAWSLEPSITQIANLRPHNKSEEFDNLYLAGASTHPGAGVPGVILSAKALETLVKKDFNLI